MINIGFGGGRDQQFTRLSGSLRAYIICSRRVRGLQIQPSLILARVYVSHVLVGALRAIFARCIFGVARKCVEMGLGIPHLRLRSGRLANADLYLGMPRKRRREMNINASTANHENVWSANYARLRVIPQVSCVNMLVEDTNKSDIFVENSNTDFLASAIRTNKK